MKKKQFKVHIYPKNEISYCIDVKNLNYHVNINTTIIINKETNEVCEDFICNVFLDARKLISDLSKELNITINSNRINKYGIYS